MANFLQTCIQLWAITIPHCMPSLLVLCKIWKALLYSVPSTASSLCTRNFSGTMNTLVCLNKIFWQVHKSSYSRPNVYTYIVLFFCYDILSGNQSKGWLIIRQFLIFSFKRPGLHLPFSQAACAPSAFARY